MLCEVFDALKKSDKILLLLQHHWKTYTKNYHMVGSEECIDNNNSGKEDCGDDEDGNDGDCIVLLPGEENKNCEEDVESDNDNKRPWTTNKRRHVGV